ncbi:fumarylacetoacetate hydrolase family protein [Aestuariibius sp. 2305UL40-4]|uniref:fumarylacetoacetate hydrolase family protein n=1 Tax=Aestuariibius violaceus TaxID=3234132 RepID=UPI00345EF73B
MKFIRFGEPGSERPGMVDSEGHHRDLSEHIFDLAGEALAPDVLARLAEIDPAELPLVPDGTRLGPAVARPGKIVCIGLNYADHAAETGATPPKEPMIFMKATSAWSGPNDPIRIPRGSEKTDWEVELAVVIGRRAKYISEAEVPDHIAGYAVMNDVSERAFQKERGGQFTKGKSADSFAPFGPWLVTPDEVADPQALSLWAEIDGHRYQDGTTADMITPVFDVIAHLSQFMTLEPGDVIATGTPAGVGLGVKPDPVFLKPGQAVRIGIEGLGEQEMQTVAD